MVPVSVPCPRVSSDLLHAAVLLLLLLLWLLLLWFCWQNCHSRTEAEEAEEEATLSSFSPDLQALCNRSELPLPASPVSMLTPPGSGRRSPGRQLGAPRRLQRIDLSGFLPLTAPLLQENFTQTAEKTTRRLNYSRFLVQPLSLSLKLELLQLL